MLTCYFYFYYCFIHPCRHLIHVVNALQTNRSRNRKNKQKARNDAEVDDYDDRDLVGEGVIDVRLFSQQVGLQQECTEKQVLRCNRGEVSTTTTTTTTEASPPAEPREERRREVCGDYDVQYKRGRVHRRLNNVPNADVCRARCLQQKENCVAWTWQGSESRRRRCILLGSLDGAEASYSKGFVSGTIEGECASLALSQLRTCACIDPSSPDLRVDEDYEDEDYYYDGDRDLVGEGAIDVRLNVRPQCKQGQGLRCVAKGANPVIENRTSLRILGQEEKVNEDKTDDSRIIFG